MKNDIGLNLYVTKAKVDKDGTFKELYINDEKVETSASLELYAWKNSTDGYIYTKKIPESVGSVSIITQSPMTDATAAYVEATPETKVGVYVYDSSTFLDIPSLSQVSEPSGTAGTPSTLWGEAYLATAEDVANGLVEGAIYHKRGTAPDIIWVETPTLHHPAEAGDVANEYETGTSIATYLEGKTLKNLSFVEYTQAALDAHITYSSDDYTRDSTKDYTL